MKLLRIHKDLLGFPKQLLAFLKELLGFPLHEAAGPCLLKAFPTHWRWIPDSIAPRGGCPSIWCPKIRSPSGGALTTLRRGGGASRGGGDYFATRSR